MELCDKQKKTIHVSYFGFFKVATVYDDDSFAHCWLYRNLPASRLECFSTDRQLGLDKQTAVLLSKPDSAGTHANANLLRNYFNNCHTVAL